MQSTPLIHGDDIASQMAAPISITDAATMYRRTLKPNMPPYDAAVIKLNNKMVDDWENTVLKSLADRSGKVRASIVHLSWSTYAEGKSLWQRQNFKERLPEVSEDVARYWIAFFREKTIEEMHAAGTEIVSHGWLLLSNAIREYFIREKWTKIYSQSKNPCDWMKLVNENGTLARQKHPPYGLTEEIYGEIVEKYKAMMRNTVNPA